jgi:hypothetical protein
MLVMLVMLSWLARGDMRQADVALRNLKELSHDTDSKILTKIFRTWPLRDAAGF